MDLNKSDGKLTTAFEIKCYRKILRIPWTDRVTNEKVLEKDKVNSTTLLHEIRKLKVGYFGHIEHHESLEKHILEAKTAGRRGKGDQLDVGNKTSRTVLKQQQRKQEEWRKIVCCFARKSEKQRPTRDHLTD